MAPFALLALACGRASPSSTREGPASLHPPPPADAAALRDPSLDDPTSFLPPEAPVDLGASLHSALSAAAATLKTAAFAHTTLDAFLLVNADGGDHYAATVSLARKTLAALYAGRIDKHPTRAVTVFVFTSEGAYDAFCRAQSHGPCPTRFGQYDRIQRTIVMHASPGAETACHELLHPLQAQDYPRIPDWLDEGIASLYENPVFCGKGHITGVSNWRYDQLRDALAAPRSADTPRVDALFSMDTVHFLTLDPRDPDAGPTDPEKEGLHYATARYLVQWLDRQGKLWPFYRAWRGSIATDPDGRKTFRAILGRNPTEVQADWEAYVRRLSDPGSDPPCVDFQENHSTDF